MTDACVQHLAPSDPVTDYGPGPELAASPEQVLAPQFDRGTGGYNPDPDRGSAVASTRPPAGRGVTYPPSVPDGRPAPARHPCLQLPLSTAEPVTGHSLDPKLAVVLALQRAHTGDVTPLCLGCLAQAASPTPDSRPGATTPGGR